MFNMFDLFRQAQGGAAFENLARAYGMSPDQMRAATAALTPAFAQGFYRQSQSDEAARRFLDLMQTETYAKAFDAHAAAVDPSTKSAGDDALSALFGSKDVSRAVAAQAAAASGVQAEIIRRVLPVLASILIGGFMKAGQAATPGGGQTPGGGVTDFWSQMINSWTGGGGQAGDGGPKNPFQDWMDSFGKTMGGGASADAPARNPMGDAMGDILNGMFGGVSGQPQAQSPQQEEPPAAAGNEPGPEEPAAGSPFDDLVATGRELSAQNTKAMEQIFDAFFGGSKNKG